MNIILTGLRGSGKSTVGKMLAKRMKKKFVDLDCRIEMHTGTPISQLVEEKGWEVFREEEKKAVSKVCSETETVIACGGGTVCYFDNAEKLKEHGVIIFLQVNPEVAAKRIQTSANRPSLTRSANEMEQIWKERKHKYLSTADIVIECQEFSPEKIVKEIQLQLSKHHL